MTGFCYTCANAREASTYVRAHCHVRPEVSFPMPLFQPPNDLPCTKHQPRRA